MIVLERLDLAAGVSRLKRLRERWDHFSDLPLVDRLGGAIQVLVGIIVPAANRHYDVREPEPAVKGPVGIRTPFGWTVVSHVPHADGCLDSARTYFVGNSHCCSVPNEETILKRQLEKFWHIESYGTEMTKRKRDTEENVAGALLRATTRFDGGRYEVGLIWKSPQLPLLDNRKAALWRFFANERCVIKNPVIAKSYENFMENLLALRQARKLNPSELKGPAGRTWYLSHHAVVYGKRPHKVRVIFDASARYRGVSLNDCLMKGPDFLVDLPGLLLKFRRRMVPLSADIESMCHQVCVPESERSVLRFFWRRPGSDEPPTVHEMCVHVFGVSSSPSSCMYALRRAAEDRKALYPLAARKISKNMYVYNLLDSVDTVEEAKALHQEVTALLNASGFRLRKWASSSRELLRNTSE
uniref:Reverse transcriptase domain-containing protein n=1 Tax=Trichuris muris TaxID=70415 RepID=A0A5S6Q745_TRIMR